jgi:hypothetical protein
MDEKYECDCDCCADCDCEYIILDDEEYGYSE